MRTRRTRFVDSVESSSDGVRILRNSACAMYLTALIGVETDKSCARYGGQGGLLPSTDLCVEQSRRRQCGAGRSYL